MNTLFIGLGGVGAEVLDYLSNKMDSYNNYLVAAGQPQVSADYYYIDTDGASLNSVSGQVLNPSKSYHLLGNNQSPENLKSTLHASGVGYAQWYDAPIKTTAISIGADTVRQYSRLALGVDGGQIRQDLINIVNRVPAGQTPRIYVITGSCGGTGSGIYMDVLYMVNEVCMYGTNNNITPNLKLIMAMPEGYVAAGGATSVQHEKKRLNAYATLMELNAVCKDINNTPSKFEDCYVGPVPQQQHTAVFRPFQFGFLYETVNMKSRKEIAQQLGDFLFEMELAGDTSAGGVAVRQNFVVSQFESLLVGTNDANWTNTANSNYVDAFNAVGHYSIESSYPLWRDYFAGRLLYETFHNGLVDGVGGIDNSSFKNKISKEVKTWETKISNSMAASDFKDEKSFEAMFSIFSTPDTSNEKVQKLLDEKDKLLKVVEQETYAQCKEWLLKYGFTAVYHAFSTLDVEYYGQATSTHESWSVTVDTAKANSKKKITKKIDAEKACKEFKILVEKWLAYEVSKALSSGIGVDIKEEDKGYLDDCKRFAMDVKNCLKLDKKDEDWQSDFEKTIGDLRAKRNRDYIPDLGDLVDNNGHLLIDSMMAQMYAQSIISSTPDFANGTCTPAKLHEKVMGDMNADLKLKSAGVDLDKMLDPTPTNYSRLNPKMTEIFTEKYVEFAKEQIDNILNANSVVNGQNGILKQEILSMLGGLPDKEQSAKCQKYRSYGDVRLNVPAERTQIQKYEYHMYGNNASDGLIAALNIPAGNAPNSYFKDKIVKLIIKNGYNVGEYNYFRGYEQNAKEKMTTEQPHDPFIDKRFLGGPDRNGKYPCDVWGALQSIQAAGQAAAAAQNYSLANCNKVEVYTFCLALLYEYFNILKEGGRISDTTLKNAIKYKQKDKTITIKEIEFDNLDYEYKAICTKIVALDKVKDINNMVVLRPWLDYILKIKEHVGQEPKLYVVAKKKISITDETLSKMIVSMRGDVENGIRPNYDFFTAYLALDWTK